MLRETQGAYGLRIQVLFLSINLNFHPRGH